MGKRSRFSIEPFLRVVLTLTAGFVLLAASFSLIIAPQKVTDSNSNSSNDTLDITNVTLFVGDQQFKITAEIARSTQQKARGLMHRTALAEHNGMLFLYSNDVTGGFWMKNTLIPLDMIFINSEKEVVHIQHNAQPCRKEPCESYRSPKMYRYVLEVNGGWSKKFGLKVGDKVAFATANF